MIRGAWSVGASGATWTDAVPTVTRLSDGADLPIGRVWVPPAGFGLDTLAWEVGEVGLGEHRVRIEGASIGEIDYVVKVVACE